MRTRFGKALTVVFLATSLPAYSAVAQAKSGAGLRSMFSQPVAKTGVVEPAAINALKSMSAFLSTAQTLQITSEGSLDVVTDDGQRIQLDGTTDYKIDRKSTRLNSSHQ